MTALVALVLAIVPGALLGFAVPPGRHRWAAWAAAPALTLGLVAVAMAWLSATGLPDGVLAVLLAELLLAGAVVLVSRLVTAQLARRRGRSTAAPDDQAEPARTPAGVARWLPPRADLICLAIPGAVSVAYGWFIMGGLIAPPGWDAMNHGYLTRRMLETGSTAIPAVCTTGSTETAQSCLFYPLAANALWAQTSQLSGGGIGAAMTAWVVVVGPLAMVAGVYACTRALGARPVVAACAAAAPAFLGPMWTSMLIGRVTQQAGPCLAAAIALLVALALRGRHPVRLGVLAGLASAGLVMTHTYDALFVLVLALALLATLHDRLSWRSAAGLGTIAATGVLALLPVLGRLLGANEERLSNEPALLDQVDLAFNYWVTDQLRYVLLGYPFPGAENRSHLNDVTIEIGLWVVLVCLLATPLCFAFRQLRWARPWLVTAVLFTAVGVWTTASDAAVPEFLSSMWYGGRERLRTMILPVYGVLTVAGAVAIGLTVVWLATRAWRRARAVLSSPVPGAVAASLVVVTLGVLAFIPTTWRPLHEDLLTRAPVGDEYVQAYQWLARNTPPGKVVAYDRHLEFMTWSYADYEVPTLFGIPPAQNMDVANYQRRWNAWNWLVNNDEATPDAGCDVRRLGIEYLAVGERRVPSWDAHYRRARLTGSDRVTLEQRFGQIRIYRVTEAGRECRGTN